jgi:[protein-PII] uridylyltransferase
MPTEPVIAKGMRGDPPPNRFWAIPAHRLILDVERRIDPTILRPLSVEGCIAHAKLTARRGRRRAAFDVRPTAIIDLKAHGSAVVIEVSGADRPGLLADLARVLADNGLSIRSAHIAGFGERAVDSFYVTDSRGRKPKAGAKLERLRLQLEAALDHNDTGAVPFSTPVRASLRDVSEVGRPWSDGKRPARPVSPNPEAG